MSTTATDLTVGSTLTTSFGEQLVVTEATDEEVTWEEVDEDGTVVDEETYPLEEVQSALDYDEIEVEELTPEGARTMEVADVDPAELDASEVYIRFGAAPADGHSVDHSTGREEAGVSVYDCAREDGVYRPRGTELQNIYIMMFRTTYLVTGEEVGTGADGEPVLEDVEAVAELKTPSGCDGWIVREETEDN